MGHIGLDRLVGVVDLPELEHIDAEQGFVALQVLHAVADVLGAGAVVAEHHLVADVDRGEARRRGVDLEQMVELVLCELGDLGLLGRDLRAGFEIGLDLGARHLDERAIAHTSGDLGFQTASPPHLMWVARSTHRRPRTRRHHLCGDKVDRFRSTPHAQLYRRAKGRRHRRSRPRRPATMATAISQVFLSLSAYRNPVRGHAWRSALQNHPRKVSTTMSKKALVLILPLVAVALLAGIGIGHELWRPLTGGCARAAQRRLRGRRLAGPTATANPTATARLMGRGPAGRGKAPPPVGRPAPRTSLRWPPPWTRVW